MTCTEGSSTGRLLDLVFDGCGRDTEFGRSFVRALLADDPRVAEIRPGFWKVVDEHLFAVPVSEAPFVVFDLETTGLKGNDAGITEIGAIRLQGSQEVGRFEQLVNPGVPIPPYVAKLTGITDAMVSVAPPIEDVLDSFITFARGAVLVAHNAAFDVAMLESESRRLSGRPVGLPSLCTIKLAKQLLPELSKTSLDALAEHFAVEVPLRHRALADAELTAMVLQRLIAALASRDADAQLDVQALLAAQDDSGQRRRMEICVSQDSLERLPPGPGVYRFVGADGEALFVGRSPALRERVVRHFLDFDHLSGRQRSMMAETRDIEFIECGSGLEAALVEAREIRLREPSYNRPGKHLPRGSYVKINVNARFPQVSASSRIGNERALYLGPLKGKALASDAAEMLAAVFGLRTCEGSLKPRADAESCSLGDKGWCSSPCDGSVSRGAYMKQVAEAGAFLRNNGSGLREKVQKLDLSGSSGAKSRFSAAVRRLDRFRKHVQWLVNAYSYLAVAPASSGDGLFVAAVLEGRLLTARTLRCEDDAKALIEMVAEVSPKGSPGRPPREDADAATILSEWRHRNADERAEELWALEAGHREQLHELERRLCRQLSVLC